MVTFDRFMETFEGEYALPDSDPIFAWAKTQGIPIEFVKLAWRAFDQRYTAGGLGERKRYADWRAVFRNAVKGDWFKVWRVVPDGAVVLTTCGEQLRREAKAEADAQGDD